MGARVVLRAKQTFAVLVLLGVLVGLVAAGVLVLREARDFWRETEQTQSSRGPAGCGGVDDLAHAGNCERDTTDPAEGYDYDPSQGATGTPGDIYQAP